MEEKQLSEEESLALVTAMIRQAKNRYYKSGLGSLLWGFTNFVCFILYYLEAIWKEFKLPFNPFYLMIITLLVHIYYGRAEQKYRKVKTFIDEANYYVLIAFGISVLILTLGGAVSGMGYYVLPVLLLFFGMATFITGCIYKFKPSFWGGIGCWILSVLAFLFKSDYALLLVSAGATIAWIIPGFILRIKYLKADNV